MFCAKCGTANDDRARFCQKCGSQLATAPVAATPPPGDPRIRGAAQQVAVGPQRFATGKDPTIALILSVVVPGVGQFYNGDAKKGAVMLASALVLGLITGGIGWLAILIWSVVDAYQVANGKSPLW